MRELKEIAFIFLKLGFITFGGPATHIALFEEEIVAKRKWITHKHFLDLVGATNLIPGPNSTEMAMHTGQHRAGFAGLITAGICFTLPSVLITGIFAYVYAVYGNIPDVKPFLYGIKPAIIVIILNAVYKLGNKAIKNWQLIIVGLFVMLISFLGINEILSLLIGGILGALFIYLSEKKDRLNSFFLVPFIGFISMPFIIQNANKTEASLTTIFLTCLKIGAVWFGGGYILVAYFNSEFVESLGWLTRQELLDAIAVGQFTPGPFLSSATFIGYQIAGVSGAIAATVGIIIPAFIFVAILNPLIPRLRKLKVFSLFLDSVNVSAIAVMLIVSLQLGAEVLIDIQAWIIAILSAIALFRIKKINSAYIILGSAILGYLFYLIEHL